MIVVECNAFECVVTFGNLDIGLTQFNKLGNVILTVEYVITLDLQA